MAETWVINENPSLSYTALYVDIQFISNNTPFERIYIEQQFTPPPHPISFDVLAYIDLVGARSNAYNFNSETWYDLAYRTVTFDESVETAAPDLYAWFNSPASDGVSPNAVKQVTGYSITYHSNGGTPIPTDLTGQTALPDPLPTVAKDGFTFNGWFYESTFETQAVAGDEISADTDLYAKFTALPDKTYLKTSNTYVNKINGYSIKKIIAGSTIIPIAGVKEPLPRLTKVTGVEADGTNAQWDITENAEAYDVLIDGTVIGEVRE